MKVLVSGGSGFIGQHLVHHLQKNCDITCLVSFSRRYQETLNAEPSFREYKEVYADLTKPDTIKNLFKYYKPDTIIHLGANPTNKFEAEKAHDMFMTNLYGTQLLLQNTGFCRFIFLSSSTVYGNMGVTHQCCELDNADPSSFYGACKLSSEHLINSYTALGLIRGVILRGVANVGSGATHGVLPDLIRKVNGEQQELELLGACPGTTKQYFYVKDTVRAMAYFLDNDYTGIFNVCPSDKISILEIAKLVMLKLKQKPLKWLGQTSLWLGDNPIVNMNNEKLTKLHGWKPEFPTCAEAITQAIKELKYLK